ncbi:ABC transporter permease [Candidatus Saccharibacteria bacterium]|nr:ABC transporter permease [Candidatus Saccharibacteria bacterium]
MKNRRLIMLGRVFINGGINFVRNAWLSIAAMAIMVVTLSIVLFSFIANATFSHTIQEIRDRIDVSVFLLDSVTTQQRDQLIGQLEDIDNVRAVEYISKDQALADYIELNKDNVDLQLAISQTENPLPASLRLKLHNPDIIDQLKSFLDTPEIQTLQSDETSYSGDRKEAIDKIAKATTFIRQAGIIGVLIFACISVLIIFNTIQMAIFNRRDELSIMRLLGASRWYIRGPFLVESLLIGISAALISVGLCNIIFSIASGTLDASSLGLLDINYASRYFEERYWMILAIQLGIGIVIGVTSSFVATQRYLRLRDTK